MLVLLRDSFYVGWRDGERADVMVVKRAGHAYLLPRRPNCISDSRRNFDWGAKNPGSRYLAWCILADFLQSPVAAERYRLEFLEEELRLLPRGCFVMAGTDVQDFLQRQQLKARQPARPAPVEEVQ